MMTRQMWKKIGVLLMLAASTLQLEAAKVMYARLADNSQTMTFYYDEDYQEGTDMPITAFANSGLRGWNSHAADITKVVIDASFADARPTSTAFWFYECSRLATIEGLRNVNTCEVTDMRFMFGGTALKQVSIGHFNTDKVETMYCMFQSCTRLKRIEMTYLTPGASLKDISRMFANCTALETIICNADFSPVAKGEETFYRCTNLKGGNSTVFNASMVSKTYARPDKSSKPGYFTTSSRVDLDDCDISLATTSYIYDGLAKTPEVTVKRKADGSIVDAAYYSISYEDNVNASGSPKVIVSGADDSQKVMYFSIAKATLKVSVTDAEKTYGEDVALSPTISYEGFVNGEDKSALRTEGQVFFEEEISQWTKAGNYKIYARYVRADNYEAEYTDGVLTIHQKDIAGAEVTIADYEYSGHPITPEADVQLLDYGTLKYYRDYNVTAVNNVEPGTAIAIITGKGNFSGTIQKEFQISAPRTDIEEIAYPKSEDAKWTDLSGQRVTVPKKKGIYIRNSKKIVVK